MCKCLRGKPGPASRVFSCFRVKPATTVRSLVLGRHQLYCERLAKGFGAKGYQENDKTVAMAPLDFLNEGAKLAGSTEDIRVDYIYPDSHSI